uniref:Trafficking protein particle complex subunit n=1 Tax=Fagus sylvatica TaxID=28930 RepID=A0A2N9FEB6_FAGSY
MSNGFTSSDIATLLSRNPHILQRSLKNQIIPSFVFFKNFLGIDENTITAIKRFSRILNVRLDTSVVSNVNLLRENGVPESNIFSFLNRIEFGIVLTEKNNGSRRMGFTGWGMVKGVGHGGGAMGWRGGGEVVIGGNSRKISPSPPAPTASGNNAHMIYVFNRNGVCLLYREWNRPLHTLNAQQDHKLMFGLLFSLKSLTAKMDPTNAEKGNLGVPQFPGQGCSFHSFRTNTYKLSFMESPSGIKILSNVTKFWPNMCFDFVLKIFEIILVTHPRTGDLRESLKYIYNLYVEYVVKNPLYNPGTPISHTKP